MVVLNNAHYRCTFRGKLRIVKHHICNNEGSSSENSVLEKQINTHQFSQFRAAVNVPEINI